MSNRKLDNKICKKMESTGYFVTFANSNQPNAHIMRIKKCSLHFSGASKYITLGGVKNVSSVLEE